jgi:hypothetical protein
VVRSAKIVDVAALGLMLGQQLLTLFRGLGVDDDELFVRRRMRASQLSVE